MDINRRIPLSAACIVAAIFACSAVPARAADAAWPALDASDQLLYKTIHEPRVVAEQPAHTHKEMVAMPDGEIRYYGRDFVDGEVRGVYLSSRDRGLSWKKVLRPAGDLGPMAKCPWADYYLSVVPPKEKGGFLRCVRSKDGPTGKVDVKWTDTTSRNLAFFRPMQPLEKSRRWIMGGARDVGGVSRIALAISADDGETWHEVVVTNAVSADHIVFHDKALRWNNGCCEPTIVELSNGDLLMAVRATFRHHYLYTSKDGGETWDGPKPAPMFCASNTMPTFLRLKDGRILFFWNNTEPLPKRDSAEYPELNKSELTGRYETVFTNRDALHAAISEDDGRTWIGFREVALNAIRNRADFREYGNRKWREIDKSVHQTQPMELPDGKILLPYGQGASCRICLFDLSWLYETDRYEDFKGGLDGLSNHLFVKSLSGNFRGWSGHCAFNRVPGALLVREPDTGPQTKREVLQICRIRDERLVSDRQGVAWNFPAGLKGRLELECRIDGAGFQLALCDHWFNPCDEFAGEESAVAIPVTAETLGGKGAWATLALTWNWTAKTATLACGGRSRTFPLRTEGKSPFGPSYMHLQTLAEGHDPKGAYFRSFRKTAAVRAPLRPGAMPPKPWLVINEDNDRYFKRADLPGNVEKTTAEACEKYLDSVVDGGQVTHFFMCVCGQRASYDSKAWEPIWKGLDGVETDGSPATNNSWCVNARKMSDAGVDPYAIWTRRCREKGVSPWISMRMNDVHFCSVSNYFRTEAFWTDHPELHLKRPEQKPGWNEHAFNYTYAKVRRHAYAMVDEILDRWDADGIELDWLRFPNNLTLGKAEELSHVLTDFMRGVRQRTDAAAKRRGHPVRIAVRIPTVYAVARHLGFDPETWAKEGLADIITVCNAYNTSDFGFDIADWQARIHRVNTSVTVLPGTDIPFACMPSGDMHRMMANGENMAVRRGWCAVHANPEGFYFFNVPYLDAAARHEIYSRSLQPERLETLPRRFIVSFHDVAAKGKCRPRQIPVRLDRPRTFVTRAARGKNDEDAYVVAGFSGAKPQLPSVTLNGVSAVGEPERLANARPYGGGLAKSAVRWKFPASALKSGENEIGFSANPDGKAQVVWCEIALAAPGEPFRDFERMEYNNLGATSDLGVGLWAWPMAMDYDGDGDLDLVVSCPDVPYNGTYLFENATPKGERNAKPVFKKAKRLGKGYGNTVLTSYKGKPVVTRPGCAVWKPLDDFCGPGEPVKGLPPNVHPNKVRGNTWRFVDWDGDGAEDVLVGVGDWTEYGWANAYDAHGSWTNGPLRGLVYLCRHVKGEGPDAEYAPAEQVRLADGAPLEVYGNPMPMAADWDGDGDLDLICGSFMDDFTFFENLGTRAAPRFAAGRKLTAADGKKLAMDLQMITPSAVDWDGDGRLDIICGDEDGRVAFIRNTGRLEKGMPVFEQPYYFRQEADCVKFGALSTPFACDWDGDGDWDVIAGSSAGYLAFIENLSGPGVAKPRWAEPKLLSAGGQTIRIQAGANGSIQGPCEAKWGYTVPTVADWDGDGHLDIVCNSIFGDVVWYRNPGRKGALDLEPARPVEVEWEGAQPALAWGWRKPQGKALLTQWRTSAVAIDWDRDGLTDLVMLDQEGYLCLFRRAHTADGRLVLQAPRRLFADGKGNLYRFSDKTAGASGRRKLCFVDWDGDGKLDIAVNDRNAFLYKQLGPQPDGTWRFRNAWLMGERRLQGHTSCPTWADFDGDGLPELLVGAEDGYFYTLANPAAETRR